MDRVHQHLKGFHFQTNDLGMGLSGGLRSWNHHFSSGFCPHTCMHAHSLCCVQLVVTHGLQPASIFCPWDSPGKNTGMGCHFLLQGNLPNSGTEPTFPASPALAGKFFIWAVPIITDSSVFQRKWSTSQHSRLSQKSRFDSGEVFSRGSLTMFSPYHLHFVGKIWKGGEQCSREEISAFHW